MDMSIHSIFFYLSSEWQGNFLGISIQEAGFRAVQIGEGTCLSRMELKNLTV
jgi:hypothetical protein